MARKRKRPVETPYQRRIRRYLERHPGASRQEARGHRLPAGTRSEYARRVAGVESPELRARASGKRGPAAFIPALREGDLIVCDIASIPFNKETGRYGPIWKLVIPADLRRGDREYVLRNQTRASLLRLIEQEIERGVIFSPAPSMDQRRLLSDRDVEGGY